ncbi:hypothetical protein SARC_15756, partial [Sphaeroforma arctica JP610]
MSEEDDEALFNVGLGGADDYLYDDGDDDMNESPRLHSIDFGSTSNRGGGAPSIDDIPLMEKDE